METMLRDWTYKPVEMRRRLGENVATKKLLQSVAGVGVSEWVTREGSTWEEDDKKTARRLVEMARDSDAGREAE